MNKSLKKCNLKKLSILFAAVFVSALFSSSSALGEEDNEKLVLTKDKAAQMAISNNSGLKKMDIALNTLVTNFDKSKDLKDSMDQQLDMLDEYDKLYIKYSTELGTKYINYVVTGAELSDSELLECENEKMNPQEAAAFAAMKQQINLMFSSDKPTKKQKYDMLIKNRDLYLTLQSTIRSMGLQKQGIEDTMDIAARSLYDTVLYLKDVYNLQKQLYEKQVKDYKEMQEKYDQAQISKLDLDSAEIDLEKSKLQFENMERTYENTEYSFKQMLGIEINRDIELQDDLSLELVKNYDDIIKDFENEIEPLECNEYINKAITKRTEMLTASIDIDNKKRIYDTADDYLSSSDLELVQAKQDYDEAQMKYDETVNSVKKEIQEGYMDMINKKSAADLMEKQLESANTNYSNVKSSYDQGLVSVSTLWNLEIAVNSSKMSYIKALRDYRDSLYKMSKLGYSQMGN